MSGGHLVVWSNAPLILLHVARPTEIYQLEQVKQVRRGLTMKGTKALTNSLTILLVAIALLRINGCI
jgi:hypothetical protein